MANKLAPGIADRDLAATNIEGQQDDDVPIDPSRPDYLHHPLPGDRGSHGPYDTEAKARSFQLLATEHRRLAWGAAAATVMRARRG